LLIKWDKPVWPELACNYVAALSSIMIQETGAACRLWELERWLSQAQPLRFVGGPRAAWKNLQSLARLLAVQADRKKNQQ
jgi:hypothetical protein